MDFIFGLVSALSSAVDLLKWIENNESPFAAAFNSTVLTFEEDIPNIRQQLAVFLCTDGVKQDLFNLLVADEFGQSLNLDLLINKFIEKTDFYYPEREEKENKVRKIIKSFLENLNYHMLKSPDQIFYLDQRQEQRFRQLSDQINGVSKQLQNSSLLTATDAFVEFQVNSKLEELWRDEIFKYKTLTEDSGPKRALPHWTHLYYAVTSHGTTNNDLLFEICTNLGSCYWQLQMVDEARQMFLQAYEQKPNDNRAKLNRALVYFLDNKEELAFDFISEVLNDNQNDPKALALKAYLLLRQEQYHSIVSMFNDYINDAGELSIENSDCCRVLAIALIETNDNAKAKAVIHQGLRMDPNNPYNKVVLGICILKSQNICCKSYEEFNDLKTAEQLFGEAIHYFEENGIESALTAALVNRTTTRLHLDDNEGALYDAEKAFLLDNKSLEVTKNLVLASWHVPEKRKKAIEEFEKLIENDKDPKNEAFLLGVYLQNDPDSALRKSNKFINHRYPGKQITDIPDPILSALAIILTVSKEYNQAEVVLEELESRRPDPLIYMLRARINFEQGNKDDALTLVDQAWQMAANKGDEISKADIINVCYSLKDWQRVIKFSEEMGVNEYSLESILEKYVMAMLRFDELKYEEQILNVCSDYEKVRGNSIVLTEVSISIYENRGDFQKAFTLWEKLVDQEPDEHKYQIGLARCVWRLTYKKENVLEIVEKIPRGKVTDPVLLMQLASIYTQCGEYEIALEMAYEGWRRGRPKYQINLQYIALFFEISQRTKLDLDCQFIQEGTAVTLKFRDGNAKTLVFVNSGDLLQPEEMEIDENVKNELLGKKEGEIIQWGKEAIIQDIRHKFVWALHTALEVHPIWHPNDNALRSFHIEDDKDKILEIIDDDAKRIQKIIDYYKHNPMPIATLAQLFGKTTIDLLENLISPHNQDLSLNFCRDTLTEKEREFKALNFAEIVVLDSVALFTVKYLGIESYLHRFKQIIVARQLYDSLVLTYMELDKYKDSGQRFMGRNDHGYFINHVSADEVREKLCFLESLISFCERSVKIMGRPRPYTGFEQEFMLPMITEDSIVSIMLAQTTKQAVLYSDDSRLREFAYNEYKVHGFNTWTLLFKELHEGNLSKKQYSQLVLKLMRSNYKIVPIDATILTEIALDKMNILDEDYEMLLKHLFSPDHDIRSVIYVVCGFLIEFFYRVHLFYYAEPFLEQMLNLIQSNVGSQGINLLETILTTRHSQNVIPMFNEVKKYINNWKNTS